MWWLSWSRWVTVFTPFVLVMISFIIPATRVDAQVSQVAASVRAAPSTLTPGKSTKITVALTDSTGKPFPARGPWVVNVTITTLGDLAASKKEWIEKEISALGLTQPWPAPGTRPQLGVIGTEADIGRWQLPSELKESVDSIEAMR